MKEQLNYRVAALLLCAFLPGCEVLCQAGSMTCGMTREEAEKVLHPKSYGEFWTQAGTTKEGWRADWVTCGGMSNGQYSGDAPSGATTQMILASQERERKKLDACMQAKGYQFSRSK